MALICTRNLAFSPFLLIFVLCKATRARSTKHNVCHEEPEHPPPQNIVEPKTP